MDKVYFEHSVISTYSICFRSDVCNPIRAQLSIRKMCIYQQNLISILLLFSFFFFSFICGRVVAKPYVNLNECISSNLIGEKLIGRRWKLSERWGLFRLINLSFKEYKDSRESGHYSLCMYWSDHCLLPPITFQLKYIKNGRIRGGKINHAASFSPLQR